VSPTSAWRRLLRLPKGDIPASVDDEIGAHLAMLTADLIAQGYTLTEARLEAERTFGDLRGIRDECVTIERRRRRRVNFSEASMSLLQDIRYAFRALSSNRGFAVAAILCTALGVGVTTSIFSAVYATLIRPLPFADPDRLVAVYAAIPKQHVTGTNISYTDFVDWRDQNRSFAQLGMYTWSSPSFMSQGVGGAERVDGAEITANLFPILGVRPALGRTFTESEATPGNNRVVILGYGLWQRRFGGDPSIVGRIVTIDLIPHTVVGVMPRGFAFPERGQAWTPFVPSRYEAHGNRGYAGAIGRLKPGVTVELARRDLDVIMARLEKEFPQENEGWRADVVTMRDDLVGNLRRPLEVFSAAVLLVLIIACANVANLTLTRGAARQRELAVRTALGAGRMRIVRQLLTESLVLATIGGLLGVLFSVYGVRLLRLGFPNDVPYYIPIGINLTTLVFAALVSVAAGVGFGMLPAFRATGGSIDQVLREGGRAGTDGGARGRLRNSIVIGELALSVMLMIGAALLVKSYRSLESTKLGFQEQGILSFRVSLPFARYASNATRLTFFEDLEQRLAALPEVASVGLAQGIPFSGWDVQSGLTAEGWAPAKPGQDFVALFQAVSPTYFATIGVPVLKGRALAATDRDTVAVVGLINATLARRAFPNQDPLGKRVRIDGRDNPWITIVGVVEDYRHYRLPAPMDPAIYFPQAAYPPFTQTVAIRVKAGDANAVMPSARRILNELDADVPPYQVRTFEQVVSRSMWRQRFQGQVIAVFAVLALVLAGVGIHGVISYTVAQRRREFGVRVALGARVGDIIRLVVRHGAGLAAKGVALGIVGALLLMRSLESLLYQVNPRDPIVFISVGIGLGAIALVAACIPARRAATADPLVAMRPD
jgi:putative ABC transport system permease protein